MQSSQIQQLTIEELTEMLANTDIRSSLDLGILIIHAGTHATLGPVTVVSTCGSRHAVIYSTA